MKGRITIRGLWLIGYLRRYNRGYAKEVLYSIQTPNFFDKMKLWYPRLIGTIFIGFLLLSTQKDLWEIPKEYGWFFVILFSISSLVPSFLYFKFEYYKATGNTDNARPSSVLLRGTIYSLIMSYFLTSLFSKHFIGEKFNADSGDGEHL